MDILINLFRNDILLVISIVGIFAVPVLAIVTTNSVPYFNAVSREDLS